MIVLRKMALSAIKLHEKVEGKCKKVNSEKLATATFNVKKILSWEGNDEKMIDDNATAAAEDEKENGSRGMLITVSIFFSICLLGCIGIGSLITCPLLFILAHVFKLETL